MDRVADTDRRDLDPAEWVNRYGDYLFGYASKRLRDSESAEEAVQETFVSGLRYRDQYAGRGQERAWLLGILKRKIIDAMRARARQRTADSADDDNDISNVLFDHRGHWMGDPRFFGHSPHRRLESQEFWDAFRGCLEGLPRRQADVFSLREIDAKSSEEVCKDLDISPSNLWVLLHRARLRLAHCLKSRWQAEESLSP